MKLKDYLEASKAVDENAKKYIFSCKACEYVKKCKFKVMTDTIPEDCPMKRG